jgi:hypothetical protein
VYILKVGRFSPERQGQMAVWTLISVAVAACWIAILAVGWMLCRAAKRADENSGYAPVVPLRAEGARSAAQRP